MNAIMNALDDVATDVCRALEEIAKDEMFNLGLEISDRLTLIKAALFLNNFLGEEDVDTSILFPLIKDFDDGWGSDDYFTFAEAFVKLIDDGHIL